MQSVISEVNLLTVNVVTNSVKTTRDRHKLEISQSRYCNIVPIEKQSSSGFSDRLSRSRLDMVNIQFTCWVSS
jgi:hypothetical protein